jgi:hypothetical protein
MTKTTETARAAARLDRQAQALWPVVRTVASPWDHPEGYAAPAKRKAEFRRTTASIVAALATVEDHVYPIEKD